MNSEVAPPLLAFFASRVGILTLSERSRGSHPARNCRKASMNSSPANRLLAPTISVPMRPHKTPRCQNLGEFLATVEKIRNSWGSGDDEPLWFRGERSEFSFCSLVPALYRGVCTRKKVRSNVLEELLQVEVSLFGDFRRRAAPLCDRLPEDDWEWYFLMQHYGGPTRLLDFSEGSLLALHFAIRQYPNAKGDAVVHLVDPAWLKERLDRESEHYDDVQGTWAEFCERQTERDQKQWQEIYLPQSGDERPQVPLPGIPLIWEPVHITRRFGAQRSQFLVFGSEPRWLADLASDGDARLSAIIVPQQAIPTIKSQLRTAGITESVIFPDLDGLGRELNQVWVDKQELVS